MCVAATCRRRRKQLRQDKKSRRMFVTKGIIRAGKTPDKKGKK